MHGDFIAGSPREMKYSGRFKEYSKSYFTITVEIHACSLVNFYRQYADRHVSEGERAIRPFVIVKNKLMSVFNASVLLLTMNFVIKLSK